MYREQIQLPTQSVIAIRLSTDEGVRVHARDVSSGKSLGRLRMREQIGFEDSGIAMTIALDEQGAGRIPSGLIGSPLAFGTSGCEWIKIPSWNGQPLQLAFQCAGAQVDAILD